MIGQIEEFWKNYSKTKSLNQIAFIAKNLNNSQGFAFNENKLFYL